MEPVDEERISGERSANAEPGQDWPPSSARPRGHGGVSGSLGFSWWVAAVVAIAAAAAGVVVGLLLIPGHW